MMDTSTSSTGGTSVAVVMQTSVLFTGETSLGVGMVGASIVIYRRSMSINLDNFQWINDIGLPLVY